MTTIEHCPIPCPNPMHDLFVEAGDLHKKPVIVLGFSHLEWGSNTSHVPIVLVKEMAEQPLLLGR